MEVDSTLHQIMDAALISTFFSNNIIIGQANETFIRIEELKSTVFTLSTDLETFQRLIEEHPEMIDSLNVVNYRQTMKYDNFHGGYRYIGLE